MQEQLSRQPDPPRRTRRRPDDEEDGRLTERWWLAKARADFWTFRRLMHPGMHNAWWQKDVCDHLTRFWRDLKAGRRPKLVLGAPPQHGKSEMMKDFCAWAAGKDASAKIIFASYADELGISANLHLQRMLQTPLYRRTFSKTKLP